MPTESFIPGKDASLESTIGTMQAKLAARGFRLDGCRRHAQEDRRVVKDAAALSAARRIVTAATSVGSAIFFHEAGAAFAAAGAVTSRLFAAGRKREAEQGKETLSVEKGAHAVLCVQGHRRAIRKRDCTLWGASATMCARGFKKQGQQRREAAENFATAMWPPRKLTRHELFA